ncbi:MAG: hypothetical protein M3256_01485 [Actinomycetota bacterium]|nr:hypothetical protein [Actinomycetota bacterium]
MTTLFEHAGGEPGLHRLQEIFYEKVLLDPVLQSLFPHRRPSHVEHLTWFTAESFGGDDRFTRELRFRYLIDQHRGLAITDAQRDRFVAMYLESRRGRAAGRCAFPGSRSRSPRVRVPGGATELARDHRGGAASAEARSPVDVAGRTTRRRLSNAAGRPGRAAQPWGHGWGQPRRSANGVSSTVSVSE